eukprot:TRINITY_DN30864_c0_g1_i1.p1 TRINITY_DN30864_c0_g1~~TRINITY_DN30864_c0_g1_i1.p1  ORF type:complete len:278 (+),score=77.89 TRINITY_DN30864_c0_g1_i1:173-1006(+)
MSDGKPKHKFLHNVYNNTIIGGEAREAITQKVLKSLPGRNAQHSKDAYAQPKEDRIADYARQEKKQAEALSEQKWRREFENWKAEQVEKKKEAVKSSSAAPTGIDTMCSDPQGTLEEPDLQQEVLNSASPQAMERGSSGQESAGDVDSLRRRVEAAETKAAQLCEERDRCKQELDDLSQDLQSRNQELLDERETAVEMESRILQLAQDRDAWENRVLQRNTQLRQVVTTRQDLIARMTTLGGRIKDMSSTITSLHAESLADPAKDPGDPPEDVIMPT